MKKLFFAFFIVLALVCSVSLTACNTGESPSEPTGTQATSGADTEYSFKSSELERYVIVYSADNPDYSRLANALRAQISEKYQKTLVTKSDTLSEPVKYEILLGDTNRYSHLSKVMEYSLTVDEGRLCINVGGSVSAEAAVEYLCENVFNGKNITLKNGEYFRTSLITASDIPTPDSTRIMSANILADAFADSSFKKAYYRAELFAGMLAAYAPDAIALQETDESWAWALDSYLLRLKEAHGISYSRHLDTLKGAANYTSLLYRSDKLRVEESGVEIFDWWNDKAFNHPYHMRNIGWAKFSFLEDPDKVFVLANTHWSYRTEHSGGNVFLEGADKPIAVNELRLQCKAETEQFMSKLREDNPDTPIFLAGDFNTSLTFFTQSGWTPTDFKILSEEAKTGGCSLSTVPDSGHFDHIFALGNYTVKRFALIKEVNRHSKLSDHSFVYADLGIGN
jgi:endonuclease/exonuclease/phosphatase family metal-dependent hydrolase/uncharacterized lipoprotein YehR (DUF1307 family)